MCKKKTKISNVKNTNDNRVNNIIKYMLRKHYLTHWRKRLCKDNHNDQICPMTVSSCRLRICIYVYCFTYDYDFGKLNPQYNQNSVLTMPWIAWGSRDPPDVYSYQCIPIRDSNRFDSIHLTNRFESIRFSKKSDLSIQPQLGVCVQYLAVTVLSMLQQQAQRQ